MKCIHLALALHIKCCIKHKDVYMDGMSCNGCVADAEYQQDLEMEMYEKRIANGRI
jgi:hypothetical protein